MNMNKVKKIGAGLLTGVMVLMGVAFVSGCTDGGNAIGHGGVEEETGIASLTGNVQVLGRTAIVEKDASSEDPDSMIVIGVSAASYQSMKIKFCKLDEKTLTVDENCEAFELEETSSYKLTLDSVEWRYGLLEVSGYLNYEDSTVEQTFHAIVDSKNPSASNVNILTDWKYAKVVQLLDSGVSVNDAMAKAEREILEAIGIYEQHDSFGKMSVSGTSKSDAVLIAASYLLESPRDIHEAEIVPYKLIGLLISDFENFNLLSNSFWKQAGIARPSTEMLLLADKYVSNLLSVPLNLGRCDESREGEALELGFNAYGWGESSSGEFLTCTDGLWIWKFREYPHTTGTMTDGRDGRVYKTTSIEIDGTTQTWMAEDLKYNIPGEVKCLDKDENNCEKIGNIYPLIVAIDADTTGFMDTIPEFLSLLMSAYGTETEEEAFELCKNFYFEDGETDSGFVNNECRGIRFNLDKYMSTIDTESLQGVCPDGWRIPSSKDWNKLFDYIGGGDWQEAAVAIRLSKRGYWSREKSIENLDDIESYRPLFDVVEFGAVPNVQEEDFAYYASVGRNGSVAEVSTIGLRISDGPMYVGVRCIKAD